VFFIAIRAELEQLYTSYKPLLFSLAYRMMGSVMDAEDIVHEAFLTLSEVELENVRNIRAYLCKIVTNRCLDRLQSASKLREVYVGTWLPEPFMTEEDDTIDPSQSYLLKESISTAYLLLLQQLSGVERAVFLLREVLQYDYDEIADMVGKSDTNCRQIFHRAKRSLNIRPVSDFPGPSMVLVEQFLHALNKGDVGKLLNLLTSDATFYSDGGGKVTAALHPIHGANGISRSLKEFQKKVPFTSRIAAVNGQPGIIMYLNEKIYAVVSFDFNENRITAIYAVANPEKLTKVR
jgi:RNA polymerase sigma-70 factor (TIGR02957 family)